MSNIDRQNQILQLLEEEKRVSVKTLARRMFASEPTIRRDLNQLAASGLVRKIYGGAEQVNFAPDTRIPLTTRINVQHEAKQKIARKAASLVKNGDIIFLDASTSAFNVIPLLTAFKDLLVITSSAKSAVELGNQNIHCYCTGGRLLNESFSFVGQEAIRMISSINADLLFFSCRGLSDEGMATDVSIEENQVRRIMMQHAKKTVLLCDSSKLGVSCFHNMCHVSDVDVILSDVAISKSRYPAKPAGFE